MTTGKSAAGRSILDGVQYLRGLAALIVVVAHENGLMGFAEHFGAMPLPSVQEAAVFGVAVFFVVSGFIIVVTALDVAGRSRLSSGEFLRRRAVRILPFLWLCTIGYNLLSWAGTGRLDLWAMLRTLAVSPVGELKPNVIWSLRHELLFYLLFALTMVGSSRWRWIMALWIAIVPLLFVLVHDLHVIPPPSDHGWSQLLSVWLMGSENGAHLQFGFGMALGALYLRRRSPVTVSATVMLAALLLASVLVVGVPLRYGIVRLLAWSAAAGGIVLLAILARPWPGVVGRGALLLGNASFSIYLIHNPAMLVLLAGAKKLQLIPVDSVALGTFLFAAVVISLLAGIVTHQVVERPLIRWIDRRTRPSGSASRPAPIADAA